MLAMFRALDCAQNEHEGVRISRHCQRENKFRFVLEKHFLHRESYVSVHST